MTYMNAWSWFLYTVLFFCGVVFSYIFIHPILSIVLTLMWIYGIIGYMVSGNKTKPTDNETKDESYFTDEDFIACKVGEWVSRK